MRSQPTEERSWPPHGADALAHGAEASPQTQPLPRPERPQHAVFSGRLRGRRRAAFTPAELPSCTWGGWMALPLLCSGWALAALQPGLLCTRLSLASTQSFRWLCAPLKTPAASRPGSAVTTGAAVRTMARLPSRGTDARTGLVPADAASGSAWGDGRGAPWQQASEPHVTVVSLRARVASTPSPALPMSFQEPNP